jgi:RNA polymerase sigma factor (sigma-70 family)
MLRAPSDERLVTRVRRGDERAFELLYDRHHRALLAFCRHMLGSREEAEDALQHVFVSAHRHLRDSDRAVQLKPWLYAIARNRCLSMLRARRETVALETAVTEPSTDGLAVAVEVERRQELRDTLADMALLPDDQRAALVLAELGDLSHVEIAEALGVRTDKVKALVFQARESLAGRREARLADCREIQEQLASLRGSALRRRPLARHVELCPACAAFKAEVTRQRAAFALVLPVVPTAALREGVLTAVLGGGSGAVVTAAAGGAAAGGAALSSGIAAKVAAIVVVAAGAGGGGAVAVHELRTPEPRAAAVAPAAAAAASSGGGAAVAAAAGGVERGDATAERSQDAQARGKAKGRATAKARAKAKAKARVKAKANARADAKTNARGQAKARGRAKALGQTKARRDTTASPGRSQAAPGRSKVQAAPGRSQAPRPAKATTPKATAPKATAPEAAAPVVSAPPVPAAAAPVPAAAKAPGPPANLPGKGALKGP